jgi:hypothetical protein
MPLNPVKGVCKVLVFGWLPDRLHFDFEIYTGRKENKGKGHTLSLGEKVVVGTSVAWATPDQIQPAINFYLACVRFYNFFNTALALT